MAHAPTPPNYNPSRQIGVAAIEFALIVTLLCLMLVGCLIYWRVLQAQQSVTRSAGDGARLARSGPGQDQQGTLGVLHRLLLHLVKCHWCSSVYKKITNKKGAKSGRPGPPDLSPKNQLFQLL